MFGWCMYMSWNDIKTPSSGMDWTKYKSDNYLIYGDSKVGKTYVATAKIKSILDNDKTATAIVINTDMGFAEPAMKYKLDSPNYKDRIKYYYVKTIGDAINVMHKVSKEAKPQDVLLFDLLGWVWEESQNEFVTELGGDNPVGMIVQASNDPKKFGLFEGAKWNFVKKLESLISTKLTRNPICKVIALTGAKDVSAEYAITKKKPDIWFHYGRPSGTKDAKYEFANIIKIEKDDDGKRYFIVIGTRRGDTKPVRKEYTTGEDFWSQIESII